MSECYINSPDLDEALNVDTTHSNSPGRRRHYDKSKTVGNVFKLGAKELQEGSKPLTSNQKWSTAVGGNVPSSLVGM